MDMLKLLLSLCSAWVDQGSQFAVSDVEVVTATVDLDEVVSYRGAVSSLQEQASSAPRVPTIDVDFNLCCQDETGVIPNGPIKPRYHVPEEEIALGELR
jgi:NAD+ synthase (glutamine-hydrolysing)